MRERACVTVMKDAMPSFTVISGEKGCARTLTANDQGRPWKVDRKGTAFRTHHPEFVVAEDKIVVE